MEYKRIDSINLICLMAMHGIRPLKIIKGRFNSAEYIEDEDFIRVKNEWDSGKYDDIKLFAKQYRKVKKMLVTKDVEALN